MLKFPSLDKTHYTDWFLRKRAVVDLHVVMVIINSS